MKILFIGDLHFGERGNSTKFNEQILEFIDWCCDQIQEHRIDTVIQVGDWFHSRHKIDVSTLNYGIEGARRLSNAIGKDNLFVILGNHDLFYLERLDVNSVNAISEHVSIVDETSMDVVGANLMMTPWVTDGEAWDNLVADVVEEEPDYLVGHFGFEGFRLNDGYVLEHGHSHRALKSAGKIITGHYHSPQMKDNVQYIGTPFPVTMSEANEDHGPWILDTETGDFNMLVYDKIKVISVNYEDIDEDYINSLDAENTSIRVEFPDGFNDDSTVKEVTDKLSSMNFESVKVKHTNTAVTEILESEVGEVESVENIDEVVLKFINNSTQIEGVEKERLGRFYKQAMEATE